MSAISEFDQDTINYLKAAGVGKGHLDRVHMLAVRAAKLEAQRATGAGTLEDGVQLMGSLMAQSSSDLAFTTNAIIANHEKTIEELRSLVYDFMKIIDEAQVIDRKTEARLDGPMTRAQIQWEMQARRGAST